MIPKVIGECPDDVGTLCTGLYGSYGSCTGKVTTERFRCYTGFVSCQRAIYIYIVLYFFGLVKINEKRSIYYFKHSAAAVRRFRAQERPVALCLMYFSTGNPFLKSRSRENKDIVTKNRPPKIGGRFTFICGLGLAASATTEHCPTYGHATTSTSSCRAALGKAAGEMSRTYSRVG